MALKLSALAALLLAAAPAAADVETIQMAGGPGGTLQAAPAGGDPVSDIETDQGLVESEADSAMADDGSIQTAVDRSIAPAAGSPVSAAGRDRAKSNPELVLQFQGLNFHDQRFANGGNQFSVEPPDQGLCAGNGFVVESTNDVLRIFDAGGNALTPAVDLNSFYGYAPAIDRSKNPLQFGPSVTDPSCYYDADTQRWFHVVLTLDRFSKFTQSLNGRNHLDIAVSTSADPTQAWVVYRLPVQNDGTQGTPDHHCVARTRTGLVHGPCLGDYPHLGADGNGFYLTTNEFNLAAPGFKGALIYAFDKHTLAANAAAVNGFLFNTRDASLRLDGAPGFTVWPAVSPAGIYDTDNGGTEFLVSSVAVFQSTGFDTRLRLWTLSNTQALASGGAPSLSASVLNVTGYGVPGKAFQKPGNIPLARCIADPTCAPRVGSFPYVNNEARLDSSDSRMQQVVYANGKVWAALDTGLLINGSDEESGIAFFVFNPNSGVIFQQGYLGVPDDNLTYPAVAVTPSGRGVIAFTVAGADHFPSAGYASLDAKIGAGLVHLSAEGAGPQDGFSGYYPLSLGVTRPPGITRERWGDYGGAVADGDDIWISSESIGQSCTYAQYLVNTAGSRFGTCGETRGSLGNWSTRISKLSLK